MLRKVTAKTSPRHRQVADSLRERIAIRALPDWPLVPSEQELQDAYGVSRGTVREALKTLTAEGLIAGGKPGQQRRVRHDDPLELTLALADSRTWAADMTRLGHEYRTRVKVRRQGSWLVRRVLREVDGPHSLAVLTFPLDIAEGTRLAEEKDIAEGAAEYLKEERGWADMEESGVIGARMPAPDETRELKIAAGTPVLLERWTGVQAGRLIYESLRILPADRTQFRLRF
jgi:GntR family transcriptional regulator